MRDPDILPVAILPMRTLVNAGVLQAINQARPLFEPGITGTGWVDGNFVFHFSLTVCGRIRQGRVGIDQRPIDGGVRTYFLCPRCRHYANHLCFSDEVPLCSDCFVDHGLYGRKTERRRDLRQASQRLERPPRRRFRGDKSQRVRLAEYDEQDARRLRGDIVGWEFSTEAAVVNATWPMSQATLDQYLARPAHYWASLELPNRYVRPASLVSMAETAVLDIRVLQRLFPFLRNNVRCVSGDWPPSATGDHEVILIGDDRLAKPFLMVAHQGEKTEDPHWQRINIDLDARGRMRLICPVTQKRCDLLFLRNGVFASRDKQRLSYPSQRASRFSNHSDTAL